MAPRGIFIPARFNLRDARTDLRRLTSEAKKAGTETGKQLGDSVLKGLRAEFNRRKAQAKEAFERGLISKSEMRRLGNDAAREFNKGVLAELDRLRAAGQQNTVQFERLQRSIKNVGTEAQRSIRGRAVASFSALRAVIAGTIAIAIVRTIGRLFELGTAVEETASAFRATFGEASDEVDAFLRRLGSMAGLTRQQARETVVSIGSVAQGLGMTREESAQLSIQAIQLAADIASFRNVTGGTAQVLAAITSALVGERESLKTYGIVLREVEVQQRALEQTGKRFAEELTNEEKALASLQLITERAGIAVGDLERTKAGAANTARRVQAAFGNLRDTIAQALLPAFATMLTSVDEQEASFDGLEDLIRGLGRAFTGFLVRLQEFDVVVLRIRRGIGNFIAFTLDRLADLNEGVSRLPGPIKFLLGFSDADADTSGIRAAAQRIRDNVDRLVSAAEERLAATRKRLAELGEEPPIPPAIPPPVTGDDPTDRQLREAERIANERRRLQQQLEDELVRLTADATDEAIVQLDRLEAAFRESFGDNIPREAEEGLARIRRAIEAEGQLAAERIRLADIVDSGDLGSLVLLIDRLKEYRDTLEEGSAVRQKATELIRDAEEAQEKLGDEIVRTAERTRREVEQTIREEERLRNERLRALNEQARAIEANVNAALELAQAFGLMGSEAARALQDVARLAVAIQNIAQTGKLDQLPAAISATAGLASQGGVRGVLGATAGGAATGAAVGSVIPGIGTGIGAAVGAVAGFIGGIFGAGKAAKEAARQLRELSEALEDNLAVRELEALGRDDEAARLRLQLQHEQELKEVREAGVSASLIRDLQRVQALERRALIASQGGEGVADLVATDVARGVGAISETQAASFIDLSRQSLDTLRLIEANTRWGRAAGSLQLPAPDLSASPAAATASAAAAGTITIHNSIDVNLKGEPTSNAFEAGQRIGSEVARGIDQALGRLHGRRELVAGNPNANTRS